MFEIKVIVEAPELSDAINRLANAYIIGAKDFAAVFSRPALTVADNTVTPIAEPKTIEIPKMKMQADNSAEEATPTKAKNEKTYTLDDLSRAGAELIDQGKMPQLIEILKKNGVQAITQLKPEQYAAVATELIALGAKL